MWDCSVSNEAQGGPGCDSMTQSPVLLYSGNMHVMLTRSPSVFIRRSHAGPEEAQSSQ